MARRKRLLTAVIALLLLVAAATTMRYRRYFYAVAWHCQHGNYATFPGHRIKLPLSWWGEKDTVRWERYFVKRACTGMICLESEIDVTRVTPSQEALIPASDKAEMDERERTIAVWNGLAPHESPLSMPASLLTLRTPSYTLVLPKGRDEDWKDGCRSFPGLRCRTTTVHDHDYGVRAALA